MAWQRILVHSHMMHIHTGLKYIESQAHLKILVTLNSNVLQIENKLNKIIKIVLYVTFDVLDGY